MASRKQSADGVLLELRACGLAYPGAHPKSPWPGHWDLAVKDKTFAYLSLEGQPFSISCKLPRSSAAALALPFTTPTGYGLGKSGWVTATFEAGDVPPAGLFKQWIDESYRAQAPKRLVAALDAGATTTQAAPKKKAATKKPAPKKPTTKNAAPKRAASPKPATRKASAKTKEENTAAHSKRSRATS